MSITLTQTRTILLQFGIAVLNYQYSVDSFICFPFHNEGPDRAALCCFIFTGSSTLSCRLTGREMCGLDQKGSPAQPFSSQREGHRCGKWDIARHRPSRAIKFSVEKGSQLTQGCGMLLWNHKPALMDYFVQSSLNEASASYGYQSRYRQQSMSPITCRQCPRH